MKLLDSDIKKYQKLHRKYFEEYVSAHEARQGLTLLVRQMEIFYQPLTKTQFDSYLKKYVNESQNQ